jgi:hypothetical protein
LRDVAPAENDVRTMLGQEPRVHRSHATTATGDQYCLSGQSFLKREPLSIVHSASCRIRQEKDGKYSNDGARDTTLAVHQSAVSPLQFASCIASHHGIASGGFEPR